MNAHRLTQIRSLFTRALEIPPEDREAFLALECKGDLALKAEVLNLLEDDDSDTKGFLRSPLEDLGENLSFPDIPGISLLGELGRGGMGVVYFGRHDGLNRDVAVKVLRNAAHLTESDGERFLREARAGAKLNHSSIVPIHDVGQTGELRYIVMDLVDGHNLGEEIRLQRLESHGEIILPAFSFSNYLKCVSTLIAQASRALHHAHKSGIVHRDIKPENIVLGRDGNARVVDFGIAKDESLGTITQGGGPIGTFYYMSPEQVRAKREDIGSQTDIYSLGVVLYELLTLERPFDGSPAKVLTKIASQQDPPRPRQKSPRIPLDLDLIVGKAIAKNRGERYSSVLHLAEDLDLFVAGKPPAHVRPPNQLQRISRSIRQHRSLWTAASLILVATLLGFSVGLFSQPDPGAYISVSSDPLGAEVSAIALDPYTGTPIPDIPEFELGTTPIEMKGLPLGFYRLLISHGPTRYGEVIRTIDQEGSHLSLGEVPLLELAKVSGDMVSIYPNESGSPNQGTQSAALAPYLMDRFEVTNGEYRRFVLDKGWNPPAIWPLDWRENWSPEWNELPVVFVNFYDAEAFAMWAGKRLPTKQEWLRAAKGAQGFPFPWGSADAPWARDGSSPEEEIARARTYANLDWDSSRPPMKDFETLDGTPRYDRQWQLYLERVRKKDSHYAGRTADGLSEIYGNVAEWTASPVVEQSSGDRSLSNPQILSQCACAMGRSWVEDSPRDLDVFLVPPLIASGSAMGFRCAKTVIRP